MENEKILTNEEAYELTVKYVEYFWRVNKFYSLKNRNELQDLISDTYLHFLEKGLFAKYNVETTTKKYFIMIAVKRYMIDLLKKYREEVSLDKEIGEGLVLEDVIVSNYNLEDEVISGIERDNGQKERDRILNSLPAVTDSKLVGYSPLLKKEVNLSYRVLALHLEAGYSVKQIAQMYINPVSGRHVTECNISKHIKNMREYILNNIYIGNVPN